MQHPRTYQDRRKKAICRACGDTIRRPDINGSGWRHDYQPNDNDHTASPFEQADKIEIKDDQPQPITSGAPEKKFKYKLEDKNRGSVL